LEIFHTREGGVSPGESRRSLQRKKSRGKKKFIPTIQKKKNAKS